MDSLQEFPWLQHQQCIILALENKPQGTLKVFILENIAVVHCCASRALAGGVMAARKVA